MNILFWTDGFWPRLGGIETQSMEFILGMQQRGHRFLVVAQKDHPDWNDIEVDRGIEIHRFDFNAIVAQRRLDILGQVQDFLKKRMKEFQPDIIHLNANVGGSVLTFLLCIQLFHASIVATVYAPYPFNNALHPVIKKIASFVDQLCCISNWVLNEMTRHLPELKSKFRLIYCGLPLPETTPCPLSFSPPKLLCLGRLSKEKGFETAVQAFSLLKQKGSNAELLIGGGGPERGALETLAQEQQLGTSVRFLGVLSAKELISAYNQAVIVIVPSLIESFGLVILESMQMQRPVIASRIEGIPEVVSENETGLLVPMKDPEALCRAIESILAQPERAIQMGIKGRERAIEKFTLSAYLDQYESVYQELVR